MVRDISLHIPTDIAHSEGEQGRLQVSTHSPVRSDPTSFGFIPPATGGSRATSNVPSTAGSIADAGVESSIQQRRALAFDGLDAVSQYFENEGLSKKC